MYHGRLKRPILALAAMAVIFSALSASALGKPARELRLVALGDSLTAGYGLAPDQAFPARLEAALSAQGIRVSIENAGVSGDTTAQGLARLDWSVEGAPDGVILELGANDGLRGIPLPEMEANLEEIIARLSGRGIPVMLCGMKAFMNMGLAYGRGYVAVFARLAAKHNLVFYPFFLEGVYGRPELNLADGLHPNPQGVDEIVKRIVPTAKTFITRISGQ